MEMAYRERWWAETAELQKILSGLDLKVERKWAKPCCTMDGRNVVIIQGFKEYCALGFFQGALLKDPEETAGAARTGSGRARDEVHRRQRDYGEDGHHQGLCVRGHGGSKNGKE